MELNEYIRLAKRGRESAFRRLFELFWEDVFRYQLRRTSHVQEAEDLAIQTFARAFDRIASFDERHRFKNWLLSIARHIQIDSHRKSRKEQATIVRNDIPPAILDKLTEPPDDPVEREKEWQELSVRLARAIEGLKPKYREVLKYYYFDGKTTEEIARLTDTTLSNVRIRLMRARKLLKQAFDADERHR
ncbi:MAG: RNA polymerase sigma factor [Chlorobi bacterium]|nr:RNA polymerase sigma factor [Chlorobiota bacterium]